MGVRESSFERLPLSLKVGIDRSDKVERTVRRSLRKSKYYAGAKVDDNIYIRVSSEGDFVVCSGMGRLVKDLVQLSSIVRYYDDKIDEGEADKTRSDIERYMSQMVSMDSRTKPVQRLFNTELSILKGEVENPKRKVDDLIKGKASDFLLLQRTICKQAEVDVEQETLRVGIEYSRLFQEMRNLANEIASFEEDKKKGGVNILEFCLNNDVNLDYLKNKMKNRIDSMQEVIRTCKSHPHKALLVRNTSYWDKRINGQYTNLLDSVIDGMEAYRREIFIMKQI